MVVPSRPTAQREPSGRADPRTAPRPALSTASSGRDQVRRADAAALAPSAVQAQRAEHVQRRPRPATGSTTSQTARSAQLSRLSAVRDLPQTLARRAMVKGSALAWSIRTSARTTTALNAGPRPTRAGDRSRSRARTARRRSRRRASRPSPAPRRCGRRLRDDPGQAAGPRAGAADALHEPGQRRAARRCAATEGQGGAREQGKPDVDRPLGSDAHRQDPPGQRPKNVPTGYAAVITPADSFDRCS